MDGKLVVSYMRGAGVLIERADEQVRLNGEFVANAQTGRSLPGVTIDGDVLTVCAVDRTVVYRVDLADWDDETGTWGARLVVQPTLGGRVDSGAGAVDPR